MQLCWLQQPTPGLRSSPFCLDSVQEQQQDQQLRLVAAALDLMTR
jgi:hypothetical protein